MTTTNQTQLAQCPHCKSVFDVSEEEMQLALGAVRCGECMKIFNARYHLVDKTQAQVEDSPSAKEQTPSDSTEVLEHKTSLNPLNTNIPTLHDHPVHLTPLSPYSIDEDELIPEDVQDDFLYIDSLLTGEENQPVELAEEAEPELEPELEPEQNNKTNQSKKISPPLIVGLFVFLAAVLVGGWLLFNNAPPPKYAFSEVRLSPSTNPKKMDVHFKLTNISEQSLPLPNLSIQLLNLSHQPISSEVVRADYLQPNLHQLEAAASHLMTLSVNRPATFVLDDVIQVHLEDSKL